MKGIMFQGTASDVGKSYVVTAICRILANKGVKVAPFKSQNMSNNSYVTDDGFEIGRAQGVQAEAAKSPANVHMNPILLKPRKDTESEIVLHGKVFRSFDGMEYRKKFAMTTGMAAIKKSLDYIEENYDCIVIEGAGSPAEVNLNDREIVNMRVAEAADVDVVLIVDIDRGGSFASVVGTLELLFEHRHRVKGIIINKFRGDIKLLEDGLIWLEEYTGVKVLGVIPFFRDIHIEVEDAQSMQLLHQYEVEKPLDIVVLHMERISNNTDVEPFIQEKDVSIRVVRKAEHFGHPDAVIIPGTKSTIEDLAVLKENGMDKKVIEFRENGGNVFGICGGLQILGESLEDPNHIDSINNNSAKGFGLLGISTIFGSEKCVRKTSATLNDGSSEIVSGFEIHLGETKYRSDVKPFSTLDDGRLDGAVSEDGKVVGTYLHNIFHNDKFRNDWLNKIRQERGFPLQPIVNREELKESSYDSLAAQVEAALDMDYLLHLVNN